MPRLLVTGFSISLDGYGAGPGQSTSDPLGAGGERLHEWLVNTDAFKRTHSSGGGAGVGGGSGADEEFAARGMTGIGAWILGRNMFGPVRGPWPDESWKGWWDANPPYHVPVFVLTHHARAPLEMEGGTTFHFVTDGIEAALERARDAAAGRDVRIGGGVRTIREYLEAGLVDEMHLAISPVALGRGEALFAGIDLPALGFERTEHASTDKTMHVVLGRSRRAREAPAS